MLKLGAHMSIAGGVHRAIERGAGIGCQAIQIFLKNNLQWQGRALGRREIDDFHRMRAAQGVEPVFAHSSYLINLAAADPGCLRRSIRALIDEVRRADRLGVPFIVLHPGSHLGAGESAGLRAVVRSLDEVLKTTAASSVRIALETTAGQGTNLGYRFEHLEEILERSKHPRRLAVCIDTAHLLAAGYDIRTARGYEKVMRELEQRVGAMRVVAFHLNDSKTPLGSRVDRHEQIGRGRIGLEGFRQVLRDPRWQGLPMVLETPKGEDLREDVENLRVLRGLAE